MSQTGVAQNTKDNVQSDGTMITQMTPPARHILQKGRIFYDEEKRKGRKAAKDEYMERVDKAWLLPWHLTYLVLYLKQEGRCAVVEPMKKPMPVGVEDFKDLLDRYYFVDKTRFIKEIIDNHGKVTLITRPRRFGKTLGLSMLRYFFTREKAEENRALFTGLYIERAGERYMAEQGTRPVVFLTLKDANARDFGTMIDMFSALLQDVYRHHRYLLTDGNLEENEVYFKRILTGSGRESDLRMALSRLLQDLERHHGRKVVLLLDEYDAPIQSAWEHGYYKDCIEFMRGFLGAALKTNDSLDFAVLTGVLRISKESIFSGLNNLRVCSVLSEQYSEAFGFTHEETAKLMEDCGVKDKLPELRKWYDGYKFGSVEIYNPWSVVRYISEGCKFGAYWINVSGNSILRVLLERVTPKRQKELESLLHGGSVDACIMENIVYDDIRGNRDVLFMMLLTTGYLKAVRTWKDKRERDWGSLEIPNTEIRMAYEDEILLQLAPAQGSTILRDMLDAMVEGDTEEFCENLSAILRDFVSYHDAAQPESFYHGLILGLSVLLDGEYRVESNRESGYGRFDIAFFPLKKGSPGVILELKAAKSEDDPESLAREGLHQIEEKAYMTEFSRQRVADVWKYGIAFCGKRVWMERG